MKNPIIRTPRQKRAIAALAYRDRISTREMRDIAGQLNVPELMAALKRNGWNWTCEMLPVLDRDGRKCHAGFYSLATEHQGLAREVIESWAK